MLRIYKASAGSGKTYTLVREYLRLAFESTNKYRHILAITFTNKAANEMKSRVIEALEGIANRHKKYDGLAEELCGLTGKEEAILRAEALAILRTMLHNYADISICTIDSFVHRVVRAFSHDLYVPMNFDIEMDSSKLLSEAVELMLDRLNEADTQVTQAIVDFAEDKIEEGKSWNIEFEIKALGRELFVDDALPHIQKLNFISFDAMREARASLYAIVKAFETKLFEEGRKGYDLITRNGLTVKDFYQGNSGIFGFFGKYAGGQFPAQPLGNSYVAKTVTEGKWTSAKVTGTAQAAIEGIAGELSGYYKNITAIWDTRGKDYYLARLLVKNFYAFILLADLQKLMEEIKRENNVLHIGDFQHKVFEIVKEQDAPVIYERIGDRYDNILIDEFQDTSLIQWRNLLPLVENSQFKNADSLVVGDGKQAIYRFRGGEVEQFAALPKIYGSETDAILMEREVAIHNYGTEIINLPKNYRSRRQVVDFNNSFYRELLDIPQLVNKNVYADFAQEQGRPEEGGFISIEFLKAEAIDGITLHDYRCARVEEIVKDALSRGYSLRDVAVLTRSNENASIIAAYLVGKGIKVISPESLLIHQSPKVRLLLSVLTYLNRKDNLVARTEILHFSHLLLGRPLRYETIKMDDEAERYEEQLSLSLGFTFNSTLLRPGRLSDLCHQLIALFQLEDDDPFVQFFSDEVLLYSSRYGNNTGDFLAWWDGVKHKKSIVYPENMDAVRIMTIHKSKGLQFPVVILADADGKKRLNKNYFWVGLNKKWLPQINTGILPVEKAMLETEFAYLYEREDAQSFLDMLNLLYVGTTRPEDALYILSTEPQAQAQDNNTVTTLLLWFLQRKELWDGFRTYTFGDAGYVNTTVARGPQQDNLYRKLKTSQGSTAIKVKVRAQLFWSEETLQHIDKGKLLHEALRRLKTEGAEENVVRRMEAEGWIKEEDKPALLQDMKAVIYHPGMNAFFKSGVQAVNERRLLKAGEKARVPDRMIIEEDGAVLIDYKTGEPNSTHARQLKDYAALMAEAGVNVKRKIIFYTGSLKMEEVL